MINDKESKNSRTQQQTTEALLLQSQTEQLVTEPDVILTSQGDLTERNKFLKNNNSFFDGQKKNQINKNEGQVLKFQLESDDNLDDNNQKQKSVKNQYYQDEEKTSLHYNLMNLDKNQQSNMRVESNLFDRFSSVCLDLPQNERNVNSLQKLSMQNQQNSIEQNSTGRTSRNEEDSPIRFQNYGRSQFRNYSISNAENIKKKDDTLSQPFNSQFKTQTNIDSERYSPLLTNFGTNMHRSKKSGIGVYDSDQVATPINTNSKFKIYPFRQSGLSFENIKRNSRTNRISQTGFGDKVNFISGVSGPNNSIAENQVSFVNLFEITRERQFSKGGQPNILNNELYQGTSSGVLQNIANFQGRYQGDTDSQYRSQNSQIIVTHNQQKQQYGHSHFHSFGNTQQVIQNKQNNFQNGNGINWNFITKVKNISRFLSKLRSQTSDFNRRMLKDFHHNLISDAADSKIYSSSNNLSDRENNKNLQQYNSLVRESSDELNIFDKILLKICIKFLKICFCWNDPQTVLEKWHIPIFFPEHTLIVFWNILFGLLLLLQYFYIPFSIGFISDSINDQPFSFLFYIVTIVACLLDTIISINSGYYLQGLLERDRKKIFHRYVRSFFIRNIVSICSLFIAYQTSNEYFAIIFFIRISQLIKIIEETAEYFQLEQKYYNYYQLGRLLFMMLYISHICCCIFHYISYQFGLQSQKNLEQTWLQDSGIFHKPAFDRYVSSFYFVVITMTTVGYGDIKPVSIREKIYVTIITILGSGIFAYTVNTIGTIFQDIERKKAQSKQRKYELTSYLNQRQVKKDIQIRVLKHLEFSQQREEDDPIRGMVLLENVSKELKEEVCKDFYGRVLQQNKIFNLQFSQQSLLEASLHFKEKIYSQGEIIFKEGQSNDHDIYYLYKGSIDLYVQKSRKQQRTIFTAKSGMFFGQGAFFSSAPRECSAKTITVCHLLVLSQSDFIRILKNHQEDYEKYCVIKDNMNIYKIQQHMTCFSCGQFNHSLLNCHLIHYKRNKDLFLARVRYSIPQERDQTFTRKLNDKTSSLANKKNVRQGLFDFRLKALKLSLQNPSQITDKQFFNGIEKIKYENEQLIIDEEKDEVYSIKKEGDNQNDGSYSSDFDEDDINLQDNSLSLASILSVNSSNKQNISQDEEFANNNNYYFQQNIQSYEEDEIDENEIAEDQMGEDQVVEDSLLNSIKEVNEAEDEYQDSDQMNSKNQQIRKQSSNIHKALNYSYNSKKNIISPRNSDNTNSVYLNRQYTNKESNYSSSKKLDSSKKIDSSKSIGLFQHQSTRVINKLNQLNTIDSNNNSSIRESPKNSRRKNQNNRKQKNHLTYPIFTQREPDQQNSRENQVNKNQTFHTNEQQMNLNKQQENIINILTNEQLDSNTDSSNSEDSEVSNYQIPSITFDIIQQNQNKDQEKRNRFESQQMNSLSHLEQSSQINPQNKEVGHIVFKNKDINLQNDFDLSPIYHRKNQNELNKDNSNSFDNNVQVIDVPKSQLTSKLVINSNKNKKYVFQNILTNSKKVQPILQSTVKDKQDQNGQNQNNIIENNKNIQSRRKYTEQNDSILKNESNQKIKVDSQQIQNQIQTQTQQRKISYDQEKKKLLLINMNEIRTDEGSQIKYQKNTKSELLQKQRSKSLTRSKPSHKINLEKFQRRSSVLNENYSNNQSQQEETNQFLLKIQQRSNFYDITSPNSGNISKYKKPNYQQNFISQMNLESSSYSETPFRKTSNISNKNQIQLTQSDKFTKNQTSTKKVNTSQNNYNEQQSLKYKKKNSIDPQQLLNQYQQITKQENDKLIEQIKSIFTKTAHSISNSQQLGQVKSKNSFVNQNISKTKKSNEENNQDKRDSQNNIQAEEEIPTANPETEMNDQMFHKLIRNIDNNKDLFYFDFDSVKIFKHYFPLNNYLNVVARYRPKKIRSNYNKNNIKRRTYVISQNINSFS